jgi:transposase-like protein
MLPGYGQVENIPLDRLISLQDAGFADWAYCTRDIDEEHASHLAEVNPDDFPPVETVKVQLAQGVYYAVIDGRHRWYACAEQETIKGVTRSYDNEAQVIEAAFRANLNHGKAASTQTRSDYAVWLYYQDGSEKPNLSEIARKVGVNVSTVSRAIKKALREEEAQEAEGTDKPETDNAAKLVNALRRFFSSERTFLGTFGDGTGKRDINARAKAIARYIARLEGDKQEQTMKELMSLQQTLATWEEQYTHSA